MKIPKLSKIAVISFLLFFSSGRAFGAGVEPLAKEGLEEIQKRLKRIRLEAKDMRVPQGWPLPSTISSVEGFFSKPLNVISTSTQWADRAEFADGPGSLFGVGYDILIGTSPVSTPANRKTNVPSLPKSVPKNFRPLLRSLYKAIDQSQSILTKALETVSEEERENFLTLYEWPKKNKRYGGTRNFPSPH